MWLALGLLVAILLLDWLIFKYGVDSRPGFSNNLESPNTPRRSI